MAGIMMIGSETGNQTGALGQGTLCCFLKKNGSNSIFLLSCWHVLKDNANWAIPVVQKAIVDSGGSIIGSLVQGELNNLLDVGIAQYTLAAIKANPKIAVTGQQREVTAFDALVSTPVRLFGKVCGLRQATIFHNTIDTPLTYPDKKVHLMKDVFSIALKDTISGKFIAPTSDGDSGALVTDLNGIPLGMVIGGDGRLSYALKFTNIFNPDAAYKDYTFITNSLT
jgi:hypothetical protein